ncbi:MAG: alpha/beta hydrolase [Burkholderiales bacterium]|nr:alpha/beta hydrolase [Burkholderiales bacterium]MCW5604527.1 alpha/beta hydrolase [Burkholderiales bacterium]
MAVLKSLLRILFVCVAAWALVVAWVWLTQARLVYFPQIGRDNPATPAAAGLPFEDLRIGTEDGETLAAWWVPAKTSPAKGAMLLFHGNAGSIADRILYLPHFNATGYGVLLVDYRGYGRSSGSPDEAGTHADARAAWRWLTVERGFAAGDIVLVGESLGGAVAAELAARVQPRALLLLSTFTSVNDLGGELYPWLPVRFISRFRYDTLQGVKDYRGPVLVAHSRDDEIVPFAHGQRLQAAAGVRGRLLEMRGGHNDAFLFGAPERAAAVKDFLGSAAKIIYK